MLSALGRAAARWISQGSPFTPVLGLVRTLLALSTFTTLAFSDAASLFVDEGTGARVGCRGAAAAGVFCWVDVAQLDWVRLFACAGLLLVASGYRPRISGPLHALITLSVLHNVPLIDGGDQLVSNLTLVLLPVTLLDPRRSHWDVAPGVSAHAALVAHALLLVARIQVAALYFQAGVSKLAVPEWANGTVLYYWMRDPAFGAPGWLTPLTECVIDDARLLAPLTWGVLVLEIALASAIVMPRERARYLLPLGLMLHLGIALVHGLISFSLAMFAALVLYLWPVSQPLPTLRGFAWFSALERRLPALGRTL